MSHDLPDASPRDSAADRPRRLGVVGTMVWDTIHDRDGVREPLEEWGGIGYAMEALCASLPEAWEIVPIVKLGADLADEALDFLAALPRVRTDIGVRVVPEPNNRVELRYEDRHRRCERLTGGVGPWIWTELAPVVRQCDALYVNFISGYELELPAAQGLHAGFRGPTYADLHSLFLGIGKYGDRVPRPLPSWSEWLRSFDAVQMNEEEFELLGRARGDAWLLAAESVGPDLKLIAVTLGPRGAAYVAGPGFVPDPALWPAVRDRLATPGQTRSGSVADASGEVDGDPTGCGDVWGATFFARLLAGDGLEEAMATANAMAARNVGHRGARGLRYHLKGQLMSESEGA
ncbi:MAG: carbohydrate kinase family protein [Gemmatimonadota bacterium]